MAQQDENPKDEIEPPAPKKTIVLNTILIIILVILIGLAIYYLVSPDKSAPVVLNTTTTNSASVTPTITESTDSASPSATPITGSTYETDVLKLTVPDGWTATEGTTNASTDPSVSRMVPDPAVVTITQGNYLMTITADATQTNGLSAGSPSDVFGDAPSVSAVISSPGITCGTTESHDGFLPNHPRVDLYISSDTKTSGCNAPANGLVWYFSYMAENVASPFNHYKTGNSSLTITMAYTGTDVNKLPSKDDPTLGTMLSQMTAIAQTLQLKQAVLQPLSNS